MAAGVRPRFAEVPDDTNASQLVDPHIGREGFLDVFGRPPRESSCECERRSDFSLPQALNLVNGRTISDAVADSNGRIATFNPANGELVVPANGIASINPLYPNNIPIETAAQAGFPANTLVKFQKLNFYPRVGAAYKLTADGKTAIRAAGRPR